VIVPIFATHLDAPYRRDVTNSGTAEDDLNAFLAGSSGLTGFTVQELHQARLAAQYRSLLSQQVNPDCAAEFVKLLAQRGGDPHLMAQPVFRDLARALAHLWYTGVWPGLAPEVFEAAGRAEAGNERFVVSARSYAEALVWKAFGGHAPGGAGPGYDSWTRAPRSLPRSGMAAAEVDW
jgi:hypothetical protein